MNLIDGLKAVAERRSGRGVHILRRGREADALSFSDLYVEAGRLGRGLLARGVSPGDRVAVVAPTSLDFARAFFGVLAAGAVVVPLPPPTPFGSPRTYLRRTAMALRQSRVRVVLTNRTTGQLLEQALPAELESVSVLDVQGALASDAAFVDRAGSDAALVQYTSGTSGDPRGVVLSHANVAAGVSAIAEGTCLTDADIGCNWLPLFHDMGLVGSFLTPTMHDVETFLLPPEEFLWDPVGWVRSISRRRVTFTMAPDSGYRYLLQRTGHDVVGDLDLSSWRLAVNGAEPVDGRLQQAFTRHFADANLRDTVFLPAYGLAEATLAVTFPPLGRPTRKIKVRRELLGTGRCEPVADDTEPHRELVSVGRPVARTEIRVVDAHGDALGEGNVGEIQVRGGSVMARYERNPDATQEVVRPGGWIATGDLGVRYDGELFIVGRRKETIIVFGANHYASDVESVVRDIPGIKIYGVVAHELHGEAGTSLGLVVETNDQRPATQSEMSQRIRQVMSADLGITPHRIVYVRRGKIPRTSSGKVRRHGPADADWAARDAYLAELAGTRRQ
jgi:fatty-acyl-CoA synthase